MDGLAVLVIRRGGHSLKVAAAIAEELGVKIGDISTTGGTDADILFLGSGMYRSRPAAA